MGTPGVVEITPHADALPPEVQQRLLTALQDTRPAGILVRVGAAVPPRKVNLELRLGTVASLLEPDLRGVHRTVRDKVDEYFAKLPSREPAKINQIVGLVMSVQGVEDVSVVRAWLDDGTDVLGTKAKDELAIDGAPTVLGGLQIGDPNLPTQLTVTILYAKDTPPDKSGIEAALAQQLTKLNAANGGNGGPKRTLSYDDLLGSLPLPKGASVQVSVTGEAGSSQILDKGASYPLTEAERLALRPLELAAK